jgi:nucleoid DNA-binding protein
MGNRMNKNKFTRADIQEILRGAGLDSAGAREASARIIDGMAAALLAGKVIELRGFGTFEQRTRKAQVMRNPRTLAPVSVPARRIVFFRPAGSLKRALNEKEGKPM